MLRCAPQLYYGAQNGAFRIFPGRARQTCNSYDPRKRPWYIAASSGPKDVVLVLDVSGSMTNAGRMALMQDAAASVIGGLTIADFVGVVSFSTTAVTRNPNGQMLQATAENQEALIDTVKTLDDGG
jgi:hypothetical protein